MNLLNSHITGIIKHFLSSIHFSSKQSSEHGADFNLHSANQVLSLLSIHISQTLPGPAYVFGEFFPMVPLLRPIPANINNRNCLYGIQICNQDYIPQKNPPLQLQYENRGEGNALFSFYILIIVMQIFGDKSNLLKERSEGGYVAYIIHICFFFLSLIKRSACYYCCLVDSSQGNTEETELPLLQTLSYFFNTMV